MGRHLILPVSLAVSAVITLPAMAQADCPAIDITTYLHDADTGDGDFAARIVTLDEGAAGTGLAIHASVEQLLRGSYRGKRVIIKPTHVSDCDFIPLKGDGGVLVGRILKVENGTAVIDPLRTATPRQRAERGEDDGLHNAPPPPRPSEPSEMLP